MQGHVGEGRSVPLTGEQVELESRASLLRGGSCAGAISLPAREVHPTALRELRPRVKCARGRQPEAPDSQLDSDESRVASVCI